ncbi:MAG TPA: DUF72 domain-containing protein [Casimicrobiaceae bacterium]|nr:DUF72 domain-containing protein [Casimicrobiaceae bacterium]
MSAIRIGISGWRYEPWRGVFYPDTLPQREELAYAARQFATIEINGSFYSLQRPEYYQRWHDETPSGFVFAVKGPRFVTHMLKLRNVDAAMANFFASGVANLHDKLGPFLWQLPPVLRFDAPRLDDFFKLLPRDTNAAARLARRHNDKVANRTALAYGANRPLRHAIEVRHESFVDPSFVAMLRAHDVALVVADTAGRWPLVEDLTSDFIYIRLHGDKELYVSGYTPSSLGRWAARIERWSDGGGPEDARLIDRVRRGRKQRRDVYAYFDNDAKVKAPRDAKRLARLLDVEWNPRRVRRPPSTG